jgi:hypothetical protein
MNTIRGAAALAAVLPTISDSSKRLQLVDVTAIEEVPYPGGCLKYDETVWIRLSAEESAVVISFARGIDRVGVVASHNGKYLSYREARYEEALQTVEELTRVGFTSDEIRP